MSVNEKCSECGFALAANDSADGPAVALIFILGFSLVPLALAFETIAAPPMWLHMIIWSSAALGLTIGLLRPLKSYIIALQFKHRPGDWE